MDNILNIYNRFNIEIVRGSGSYLYDTNGKKYIDFMGGIATVSLGHCNEYITKILKSQIDTLWHCYNSFIIPEQIRLANRLTDISFADRVFFCSSGLEAVETCFKVINKYHIVNDTGKSIILSMKNGFHGRGTMGISANSTDLAKNGFVSISEKFRYIEFNSINSLENQIDDDVAAIILEIVQSEGGVNVIDIEFLRKIRDICDNKGIILFFDEVQTGFGRLGSMFGYEIYGIEPDIMACAKAMGNGFPVGACLMRENIAKCMNLGSHGSTYGGNPLAMVVANAVLDIMLSEKFMVMVNENSNYLFNRLNVLSETHSCMGRPRGSGMLIGFDLILEDIHARDLRRRLLDAGLIVGICNQAKTIRLTPPLNIDSKLIDNGIAIIDDILSKH